MQVEMARQRVLMKRAQIMQ
jgi:hypothetical protein